jgi:hypothetical protein
MKRTLQIVIVLFLAGLVLVSPVAAATNQGLDWGFGVNDKIEFTYQIQSATESFSEAMYIDVQSTPNIPDSITSWSQIPVIATGSYWANDTGIGWYALIYAGLLPVGGRMAMPTGNWTLLKELVAPVLTGENYIDDLFYWGLIFSDDYSATEELRISLYYYKSDGFLAKLLVEWWDTTTDTRTQYIGIVRSGVMSIIADNYILIGVGAAVLIILAIVCVKRK